MWNARPPIGLIKDLSQISAPEGSILRPMPFRLGEEIILKFMLPHAPPKQLHISGQIVRITPFGVGVRFKRLTRDEELFITSHCGHE